MEMDGMYATKGGGGGGEGMDEKNAMRQWIEKHTVLRSIYRSCIIVSQSSQVFRLSIQGHAAYIAFIVTVQFLQGFPRSYIHFQQCGSFPSQRRGKIGCLPIG